MGDLGVVEHDGIVAAISPGQEASVRDALGAPPEAKVSEPEPRERPTEPEAAQAQPEESDGPESDDELRKLARKNTHAALRLAKRELKAAREAAAARDAELQELRTKATPRSEPVREPEPIRHEPAKPVSERFTFDTYEAWSAKHPDKSWDDWNDAKLEAYGDWRDERAAERNRLESEQKSLQTAWTSHQERLAQARQTKYPDFDSVVQRADQHLAAVGIREFPPAMMDAIVRSGRSDDVLYYLGTHPEEAVQLARMSAGIPTAAAGLVQRLLETSLGAVAAHATGSTPPPRQSRSAPPPNPVGSTPHATSASPGVLDVDAEIDNYRRAQQAKRRRG
jgi:hypothetical protein